MASSAEPSGQPRKKWTRAKVPKSRTGCITCKFRHLKCDETKPTCQRCAKDRLKCDGYKDSKVPQRTMRLRPKQEKTSRHIQHQLKPRPPSESQCVLMPALSITTHASDADAALFYHARQFTIEEFDVASCLSFWRRFVVPLAHTIEPVKYALCALGAAHRRFVTGYGGDSSCASRGMEFEIRSIQKYNQAITYIKPLLSKNTESNLQITLVCCVIFICIENLHGRYKESIRHLHAGCQLLNSICGKLGLGRSHLTRMHVKEKEETEYNLFEMVTEMLYRLGQNVAEYIGNDSFGDLDLPPRFIDMGNPGTPFASLVEADSQLDLVDDIYDSSIIGSQFANQSADRSTINTSLFCPDPEARKLALAKARFVFTIWNSRYELTKKDARYENPSPEEQYGLAFLDMHQAIWSAIVRLDTIDDDFQREDCEAILQKVSVLIERESDKTGPVFAFNGYLIPALSIVCSSCRDADIQRRSISLLRTLHRREGIWDSQEVASIYEIMMAAGVQNMVDWDTLPWGIPQLVAKLSTLPVAGWGLGGAA